MDENNNKPRLGEQGSLTSCNVNEQPNVNKKNKVSEHIFAASSIFIYILAVQRVTTSNQQMTSANSFREKNNFQIQDEHATEFSQIQTEPFDFLLHILTIYLLFVQPRKLHTFTTSLKVSKPVKEIIFKRVVVKK